MNIPQVRDVARARRGVARNKRLIAAWLSVVAAVVFAATQASASGQRPNRATPDDSISFSLVRSTGVVSANCLTGAKATVTVTQTGQTETMQVTANHLPPNREFDLFVIQVPDAPFGDAWYQGDLDSNGAGHASGTYVGRFSIETFLVAPGSAPAPVIHKGVDASSNPASAPVHMFHLGLWFGSPAAAVAAGCPNTVTPFNGDHNAGIQAMSTRQFSQLHGPLRKLD